MHLRLFRAMAAALLPAGAPFVCACGSAPSLVPGPAPAAVCPAGGCDGRAAAASADACGPDGKPACSGVSAAECAESALAAWGRADDDRSLACIGRKLTESCKLGDKTACAFGGRMALAGHGVAREPSKGIDMLLEACDADVLEACSAAVAWLSIGDHARVADRGPALRDRFQAERGCLTGMPEDCFRVGLGFRNAQNAYPRDPALAARAYERGCSLGHGASCVNLGGILAFGDRPPRDVKRALALFDRACALAEPAGCSNLAYCLEEGIGVARDAARARALYRRACDGTMAYGCIHLDMIATPHPADAARALAAWQRACSANDGRACAFAGVVYDDNHEGITHDEQKTAEFMSRGCDLGYRHACEWAQTH